MYRNKQRLTITLDKDVLALLDDKIDGINLKNRSHAIEFFLRQNLYPTVKCAVVLAGNGKIKSTTGMVPKTLAEIDNKPVLAHLIERLHKYGIEKVIMIMGNQAESIQKYFKDGSHFGVRLLYITDKKQRGTASSLKLAAKHVASEPFLLAYGDVLADINLRDFFKFHFTHKGIASVAITSVHNPTHFGTIRMHGNQIVNFIEKPKDKEGISHTVNAGMMLFDPQTLPYLNKETRSLEKDVFPRLIEHGLLFGYNFSGQWFDVGVQEIYDRATKEWVTT